MLAGLAQNVVNNFAMDIGQSKVSSLITIGKLFMIDPHQVH